MLPGPGAAEGIPVMDMWRFSRSLSLQTVLQHRARDALLGFLAALVPADLNDTYKPSRIQTLEPGTGTIIIA